MPLDGPRVQAVQLFSGPGGLLTLLDTCDLHVVHVSQVSTTCAVTLMGPAVSFDSLFWVQLLDRLHQSGLWLEDGDRLDVAGAMAITLAIRRQRPSKHQPERIKGAA